MMGVTAVVDLLFTGCHQAEHDNKGMAKGRNCIQRDIPYALFRCLYIVRG